MNSGVNPTNTKSLSEKPFRALSLDGGGMRGLYTIYFLQYLIQYYNKQQKTQFKDFDIGKKFNLIAGTSTGSILGCGMAYGMPLSKIKYLYTAWGPKIFQNPSPTNKFHLIWWALKTLYSPANNTSFLHQSLNRAFKEETLQTLFEKRNIALCVPSVNMKRHSPQIFKTPHRKEYQDDAKRKLKDICIASAAAPVILPLAQIPSLKLKGQMETYCDGGFWANNPVLIALIECLLTAKSDQDIQIVTLGTGPSPTKSSFTKKEANRGILDWKFGGKISELSVDTQGIGTTLIANLLAKELSTEKRKITIIRPKENVLLFPESEHLGIDVTSKKALKIWDDLGHKDAELNYKESLQDSNKIKILKDIFSNLKEL